MEWLKVVILSSFFLILMPFVLGDINITIPEKDTYNLGEKIDVSVSIQENEDYNGFLKAIIKCESYDLQYYTSPLSLEANYRTQIQVPELTFFASMVGMCNIKVDFEDTNGDRISKTESNTFLVTSDLNISTEKVINSLPDKIVILEGTVKKINNESLDSGNVKISFRNKEFNTEIEFGEFKYNLSLDSDLDIGNYPILIAVEDKNENYANEVVQLNVLPIATRIENRLENEKVKPGNSLKARIILYDRKNRVMNGTIKVDLIAPDEKELVSKKVVSLDWVNYEFSKNALPGTYRIISIMEDLREETRFEVEVLEQISMSYGDEVVIVENTGNVDYDDETTIILERDDKKYLINKRINLKPGETLSIDLSKEVPYGSYDIILPQTETKTENETSATNIIEDVIISDNRPAYKKVSSIVGAVSGFVVNTGGYIASRPLLASIILIVIILLIVLYYSRGAIMNKIRGEKPEDTNEIFKDFKYEDWKGKKL